MQSRVRWFVFFVAAAAAVGCAKTAFAQAACEPAPMVAQDAKVRTLQQRLAVAMNQPSPRDIYASQLPAQARTDIRALKDALVAVTDARLACEPASAPDVKALQGVLAAALGANRPAKPEMDDGAESGLAVRVELNRETPPWLLVRLGFPVICGDDNLLLVYAYRDGSWRRIVRWQSGEYTKIYDAWGNFFDYVVLPSGNGHGRRIVVAHGSPWCTSRWSRFFMEVIEPDEHPDSAHRVFGMSSYDSRTAPPVLELVPDGFEIRLPVSTLGDPDMVRTGIFRYRQAGTGYKRVQPAALDPLDFVGAWLSVTWPQAAAWTEPASVAVLREVHRNVTTIYAFGAYAGYGAVHMCSNGHYQVALLLPALSRRVGPDMPMKTRYLQVHAGRPQEFRMFSSSMRPDPTCTRVIEMKPH